MRDGGIGADGLADKASVRISCPTKVGRLGSKHERAFDHSSEALRTPLVIAS